MSKETEINKLHQMIVVCLNTQALFHATGTMGLFNNID